jgi:hypothetical protein
MLIELSELAAELEAVAPAGRTDWLLVGRLLLVLLGRLVLGAWPRGRIPYCSRNRADSSGLRASWRGVGRGAAVVRAGVGAAVVRAGVGAGVVGAGVGAAVVRLGVGAGLLVGAGVVVFLISTSGGLVGTGVGAGVLRSGGGVGSGVARAISGTGGGVGRGVSRRGSGVGAGALGGVGGSEVLGWARLTTKELVLLVSETGSSNRKVGTINARIATTWMATETATARRTEPRSLSMLSGGVIIGPAR